MISQGMDGMNLKAIALIQRSFPYFLRNLIESLFSIGNGFDQPQSQRF